MVNDIELEQADLRFKNGDFVLEESDQSHIERILLTDKGNWRNSPITGAGLFRSLNGPNDALTVARKKAQIQKQLEYDGYGAITIQMTTLEDININAERL